MEMKNISIDGRELCFLQEYFDGYEIHIIVGLLKNNGISYYVDSTSVGSVTGYCYDSVPQYRLFVELEEIKFAKELICEVVNDESSDEYNASKWNVRKKQNRIMAPVMALFFTIVSFWMFYYSAIVPGIIMMGGAVLFLFILLCSERAIYQIKAEKTDR